jgi:hypothetical protein
LQIRDEGNESFGRKSALTARSRNRTGAKEIAGNLKGITEINL